ncbi:MULTISPECIES: primosomal replication protein PriC [Corallincola]|uniref:Primosomal replication protein N n=3 Tax=Corallincola TaxID=1775176 RepID=A0A368NFR0_9GAMM|nr:MULTISPECIES: primosomal replication protein PriC [Corallincola]RCU49402.1 hypothetical protein DU002_10765 [Corallincola holothuriorum]TAA47690.1 hypothetical protein EXY25_00100 [Corallincola spongiicola]TCI01555.1 hypothetical protein EZV61_17735 [Corallincola luteus]
MVNSANQWLQGIGTKIDALDRQIKEGHLKSSIRHEQLFGTYPVNLKQACQQCRETLARVREASQRHKSEALLQYYCEQLNDQLAALFNAVKQASQTKTEQHTNYSAEVLKLKEQLDKHREYERRLLRRVQQCQHSVDNARSEQFRQQWLNWLQTEKSRLQKCRQASAEIEDQLELAQRQHQ